MARAYAVIMRDGFIMSYWSNPKECRLERNRLAQEGIAYLQETMSIRLRDSFRYPL